MAAHAGPWDTRIAAAATLTTALKICSKICEMAVGIMLPIPLKVLMTQQKKIVGARTLSAGTTPIISGPNTALVICFAKINVPRPITDPTTSVHKRALTIILCSLV